MTCCAVVVSSQDLVTRFGNVDRTTLFQRNKSKYTSYNDLRNNGIFGNTESRTLLLHGTFLSHLH